MAGSAIQKIKGFHVFSAPNDAETVTPPSDIDKTIMGLAGEFMDLWLWAEGKQTQGSGEPLSLRDASAYGRTIAALAGGTASIVSASGQLNGKPAILFDGTPDGSVETQWCPTSSYFCVFALRNIAAPGEMHIMGQTGNSGLTRSEFSIHQLSSIGQGIRQSGTLLHITGTGNSCANDTDHVGWFSYNADDDTVHGGWDNVAAELIGTFPNAIDPINTVWRFGGSSSAGNFFNGKFGSVIFLNTPLHGDTDKDTLRAQLVSEIGSYYGVTIAGAVTVTAPIDVDSGLGAGVSNALSKDIGTSGAVVVQGGDGGTPSDLTLTNATDLPISTGVAGLGSGVAAALGNTVNAASGVPALTSAGLLPTALTRTIDARNFGVVGNSDTTARASLTDNTAKLQDIITYVKSLTSTTGLSSIQAEVPIMTVVDLPPGYVGVTASTLVWQEPHTFIPNYTEDNRVAVLLDCDNIVFRGNGTTIVHKDNGDPAGYSYLFGTGYQRALETGSNPIQVWSGLRRCYVTCSKPHRLTAGDVIKIGGSMADTNGVTFSAISGYQTVAAYPVTATKFYFFYNSAFAAASANGNIGSTTLTFTALRSVSGIGFIGDLTFNCSRPATIVNGIDTAALFLNGANDVYIDAKFRSANASSFAGRGIRAYNSKRIVFANRCTFDTMSQGLFFAYCGDIDLGDLSFFRVTEGVDIQLACCNIRAGKLYGKFDADFQPEDASRTQERQLIDISDAHNVHIDSIITERYYKPIFIYPKNEWSTYTGYLDNAGTLNNLNPWGCQDIYVGSVIATNDDGYASDFLAALFSWHQASTIGLSPVTNPFTTANGSSTVTYTNSVAHRVKVGDPVSFGGTISSVGGLTSGNISGSRTVLAVPTPTTFTFTAGASATSDATGGGSAVTAGMPNKGVANVPAPKNIRIGSYSSRGCGYVSIEAGAFSFGNIDLDATPGTGAALRIGSLSVTDPDTGALTVNGSASIDRLAISNCALGLTITGTPTVRFGDVVIPSTVTTPMSSISITANINQYSVPLGAVAVSSTTLDKALLAPGAKEGAFIVQGWLSNAEAITADGTNYATAQLVKVSSGAVATIGGSAVNYGSGAINAAVTTALNGNGTDADGLIGPSNVAAVRFTKAGSGKTYPDLTAKLSAIRWRTE